MNSKEILAQYGPRDAMEYDDVAGGLATAIRLKQLAAAKGTDVSVVVLEKGSEPGAIMNPIALNEIFPDWKAMGAPLHQPVTDDAMVFLGETTGFRTPKFFLPDCFQNHGNYIVSLGAVTRWLTTQAKIWAWKFSPASQRPRCSIPRMAR